MFKLRISSLILRYYLMMVVVIAAVYTDQSWLVFAAFAIAVSAILGYRIGGPVSKESVKVVQMEGGARERKQQKVG